MSLTPHGPGFSFLDEIGPPADGGAGLRARKWLDPEMPFFADHFPGRPLMPGVLMIEMAAQTAGAIWGRAGATADAKPEPFVLAQVRDFRLKRTVPPGRWLECEAMLTREFGGLALFSAQLFCEGETVATGEILLGRPA